MPAPVAVRYAVQTGEADPYALVDDAFLPLLVADPTAIAGMAAVTGEPGRPGQALAVDGRRGLGHHPGRRPAPGPGLEPVGRSRTTVASTAADGWLVDLRGRPAGAVRRLVRARALAHRHRRPRRLITALSRCLRSVLRLALRRASRLAASALRSAPRRPGRPCGWRRRWPGATSPRPPAAPPRCGGGPPPRPPPPCAGPRASASATRRSASRSASSLRRWASTSSSCRRREASMSASSSTWRSSSMSASSTASEMACELLGGGVLVESDRAASRRSRAGTTGAERRRAASNTGRAVVGQGEGVAGRPPAALVPERLLRAVAGGAHRPQRHPADVLQVVRPQAAEHEAARRPRARRARPG